MSIKNFSKGSIAVYVTAFLAVLFVFSLVFSPSLQNNTSSNKYVGKVSNVPIQHQDFYLAYESIKNKILSSNPSVDYDRLNNFIMSETWSFIHTRYSIQAMMDKYGFVIPKYLIEKDIKEDPFFQENGTYDAKKFKKFLKQKDINIDHLMKIKGIDMMQNAIFSISKKISTPTPNEIDLLKEVASARKQISVMTLDVNKQEVQELSDKELKTYYDSHQIDFVKPNQFQYKFAIIDEKAFKQSKSPSLEELKAFFNQNIENYVKPEQVLIDVRVLKVNQNSNLTPSETNFLESFLGTNPTFDQSLDDIALHHGKGYELISQDPLWKPVTELPPELITEDFLKLKKPIINIGDDNVIVIIQNKAYKDELVPKFAMVVSTVREDYQQRSANEQFQLHMDDLMDQSYSGSVTWDKLAGLMSGLSIKKTKLLDIANLSKVSPFKEFPELSKWLQTTNDNKAITLKSVGPNKVVVIQQINYVPKHVQSYEEVKPEIKKLLMNKAKLEKTQSKALNILKAVKPKKDYQSLNQSWQYLPKVTYAYNDINYPNLIWTLSLQQNPNNNTQIIDDLATSSGHIYLLKYWKNTTGSLNDVFYGQLQEDWRNIFANDLVTGLVDRYKLKKFIDA